MRVLRSIDLIALAVALPIWIAASLPALGYAAAAVSWVAARSFQTFLERRATAKGQRKAMLGARAASLLGRLYLVTIAVFVAGIIDRESGLTGGVLAVAVFTFYFVSLFVMTALEDD